MALANRIEFTENVPHEEGQWFKFRRLSAKQLEAAKDARQRAALGSVKEMPELFAAIRSTRDEARAETAPRDPLEQYDRWALLKAGLVDWSYDVPLTPEAIEELDEETLDWAARLLIPKPLPGDARLESFR